MSASARMAVAATSRRARKARALIAASRLGSVSTAVRRRRAVRAAGAMEKASIRVGCLHYMSAVCVPEVGSTRRVMLPSAVWWSRVGRSVATCLLGGYAALLLLGNPFFGEHPPLGDFASFYLSGKAAASG